MKTLITGGTGFVGSALTRRLLQLGHDVTLVSSRGKSKLNNQENLYHLLADTTKEGEWQMHVADMDVVVNLTGRSVFHLWSNNYKKDIWASRILTTKNLVSAIPEGKGTVLLSASAAGYYGDGGEDEKSEEIQGGNDFLAKVCKEWENMALQVKDKGARVATMRFGVVLGRGGGAISTMKIPFLMALGGPIGNGQQWFPWIHIDDLVEAMIHLLGDHSLNGPFNFTAPQTIRQKDFATTMAKVLQRPAIFPVPAIFMKLLLGEFGSSLLQGQKVTPKALSDSGFVFTYPDVKTALEEILLG